MLRAFSFFYFFKKIDEGALDGLKYLKEINLSNNTLNSLENNLFLKTISLNVINFNYNNLKTIDEQLFMPIMNNLINNEDSLITFEGIIFCHLFV